MSHENDIRQGRHCVFLMHVHLVFVTKYRYFAESCGGAPIEIIRQYIEQQQTPTDHPKDAYGVRATPRRKLALGHPSPACAPKEVPLGGRPRLAAHQVKRHEARARRRASSAASLIS
jgi:hypothetical protein